MILSFLNICSSSFSPVFFLTLLSSSSASSPFPFYLTFVFSKICFAFNFSFANSSVIISLSCLSPSFYINILSFLNIHSSSSLLPLFIYHSKLLVVHQLILFLSPFHSLFFFPFSSSSYFVLVYHLINSVLVLWRILQQS